MQRTLACPGCRATFETAAETVGATIRCPQCEHSFRVPPRWPEPPAPPPLPPPLPDELRPAAPRLRPPAKPRRTASPLISAALVTVLGFLLIGTLAALVTLAFLAGRGARDDQTVVNKSPRAQSSGIGGRDTISRGTAAQRGHDADGTSAVVSNGEDRRAAPDAEAEAGTQASAVATPSTGGAPKDLVALIEAIEPSVVRLNVKTANAQLVGSGFVVDTAGTLVTNYHVVEDARGIEVKFNDGKTAPAVSVLHVEPAKDIAVVHVQCPTAWLHPLRLAEKDPRKGETVTAFGAPLGLSFSASNGIVSSVRTGDDVARSLGTLGLPASFGGTWIQTTAPISHGNSGGPLVNLSGLAVGMNTLTFNPVGGENINFAVSAADIRLALGKAAGQTPRSLAETARKSAAKVPVAAEPARDTSKIFVNALAFQNNDMNQSRPRETAALRSKLVAALKGQGFRLVLEPQDAGWALLLAANYLHSRNPGAAESAETCDLSLGFFQREVRSAGDEDATLFWERRYHCRGNAPQPQISRDVDAKLDTAIQDLRRFLGASPERRGNH